MTCVACTTRATRPHSGAVRPDCWACRAWEFARGPATFENLKARAFGRLAERIRAGFPAPIWGMVGDAVRRQMQARST